MIATTVQTDKTSYLLNKHQCSSFRGSFHLSESDKEYAQLRGLAILESHAYDMIQHRIKDPLRTIRTPYKGHPIFTAQHATATCLQKLHVPLAWNPKRHHYD